MEIPLAENRYSNAIRWICTVFGAVGILNSLFTVYYTSFNLGTALPGMLGVVLLTYGLLFHYIERLSTTKIGSYIINFLKIGFLLWLVSFLAVTAVLVKNAAHTPMKNADAIIVLGAGLNGDQVSQTLAYRLDKAIEYYEENGQPPIVVSGGQGSNELVAEAVAMEQYLVNMGVKRSDIIREDQSHNTRQNFEYSKLILDEYFASKDYTVVYVTNQFHTFRAGLLAEKAGFTADGLGAASTPYLLPNQYFREYFSLIKYALIDSRQ